MRRTIIAANWKMNNLTKDVITFFAEFGDTAVKSENEVIVAPAYPYIPLACALAKSQNIELAAQDVYPKAEGAFTGMVGGKMLDDLGVKAVIIGHSKRRRIFGEPLDLIREKVRFVQENGLHLIFCVGETLPERENGSMFDVKVLVMSTSSAWAVTTLTTGAAIGAAPVFSFVFDLQPVKRTAATKANKKNLVYFIS